VHSTPLTVRVDQNASLVQLGDGVSLEVPAGAFSSPNELQVTRVDVGFDQISFDALSSPFYLLSLQNEVGTLGAPLVLEVPIASSDVSVVVYDGQTWQPVDVTPGPTVRVEVTHFSSPLFGFVEWWSEASLTEELADNPSMRLAPEKMRQRITQKGDDSTHAFFGVGDKASQSQDDMCNAILAVLAQYNTTENRAFPSDFHWYDTWNKMSDLAAFLHAGSAPSEAGGYYWSKVAASQPTIDRAVLASDPNHPLSPADLLKIAIDANGGNIPLGVLAAHNYLKEIKYKGLNAFDHTAQVPDQWGLPAAHLQSWRTDSNINPAGDFDKMGPLYHIFAAMTAGVWAPFKNAGQDVADGEALLRSLRHGQDRPDLQKAAADQCGAAASLWLDNHSAYFSQAQPPPATTPENASADECDAGQWIKVQVGSPVIESAVDSLGFAQYECDQQIHFIDTYPDPQRGIGILFKLDRSLSGQVLNGWQAVGSGMGGNQQEIIIRQYRRSDQDTGYAGHEFYLVYQAVFTDLNDPIRSLIRCAWVAKDPQVSGLTMYPLENACK
jgi:hypothetical protein